MANGVGMSGESVDLNSFMEVRGALGETLAYVSDIVDAIRIMRNIEGACTAWRIRDGKLLAVHPLRQQAVSTLPPPVSRTVSTIPPASSNPVPAIDSFGEPEKQSA